ncbi:MAG: ATP-binding protein [Deltaproteobacteria bacterium]|nr:ATP-binding protein [Deltaproteobacteria bacterium]
MVDRPFWRKRLEDVWRLTPIAWLTGVRRVGKTTLAKGIPNARYLNCDLPSTVAQLRDPERFYTGVAEPVVIFDEVHQLPDPSLLLKIGADQYPHLKILATGSSTLAATKKFRDSLAGRKQVIHLFPVLFQELNAFGTPDLDRRLLYGGLPPIVLAKEQQPVFYAEWLDSFYARDVQELFHVEKRAGFLRLLETLLRQSGGLAEAAKLGKMCELSRPTILNYLNVLQVTHAIAVLRPYHDGGKQELVRQPKIYGFDTGFVAYCLGWNELRPADRGPLWEHVVLETLLASPQPQTVHYWRDKQQHEIDFVIPRGRGACDAIECKWDPETFDPDHFALFRRQYPSGRNVVVTPQRGETYRRTMAGLEVTFLNPTQMMPRENSLSSPA